MDICPIKKVITTRMQLLVKKKLCPCHRQNLGNGYRTDVQVKLLKAVLVPTFNNCKITV